jgi:hypothetical protein
VSDLESKLALPERAPGDRAQAKLHHLLRRWGSPKDIDPKKPPELIMVRCAIDGFTEWWKRVGPREGKDTLYALSDKTPIAGDSP